MLCISFLQPVFNCQRTTDAKIDAERNRLLPYPIVLTADFRGALLLLSAACVYQG
jgi:hypothetical protein